MGLTWHLNQSAMELSDEISKNYIKNSKIGLYLGDAGTHDFDALNAAGAKYGIKKGAVGEAMVELRAYPEDVHMSMDTLKKHIYDGITGLLFEDKLSGWGHAIYLLNYTGSPIGDETKSVYGAISVGIQIDKVSE